MTFTPFKAIYPNVDKIDDLDQFFDSAKVMYPAYWRANKFLQEEHEALYVYDIVSPKRVLTGLVGCLDVNDYLDGRMVKHEHTIAPNEARMLNLYRDRNAFIKPVLLTYPSDEEVNAVIQTARERKPFLSLEIDDG